MKRIVSWGGYVVIVLGLNACVSWGEEVDLVAQGSLTLTPLIYPDDLMQPVENKSALRIPQTIDPRELAFVEADPAPPPLDLAKANAEMESLKPAPESKEEKITRLSLASSLKKTPEGNQYLIVNATFDRVWESMPDIARELGFNVEDRNRSKHYYNVFRNIAKTAEQEKEEEESGIVRELGNKESYQVYIDTEDPNHTLVSIRNQAGQDDDSGLARLFLVQIKAALEQPIN